jgi:hypothetical protein
MKWKLAVSLLAVLSLFGVSAHAQDTPKVDIFAGYSYVRNNPSTSGVSSFSLNGGSASVAYNANSWLSGVADGGYHSEHPEHPHERFKHLPGLGRSVRLRPRNAVWGSSRRTVLTRAWQGPAYGQRLP